jgi:hypothetical protein
MVNTWALSALWLGLALAATLLAIWFRISTALSEIVVGTVIASAVIPTMIANMFFLPRHLLPHNPAGKKSEQIIQRPTAAEQI